MFILDARHYAKFFLCVNSVYSHNSSLRQTILQSRKLRLGCQKLVRPQLINERILGFDPRHSYLRITLLFFHLLKSFYYRCLCNESSVYYMTYVVCFKGFYPLIGWKIGQEVVCLAEGNAGDTGTAIKWAQQLGKSPFIQISQARLK